MFYGVLEVNLGHLTLCGGIVKKCSCRWCKGFNVNEGRRGQETILSQKTIIISVINIVFQDIYPHSLYNSQVRRVMLQGPFLHFTDEWLEVWQGWVPCPKLHSKWKSWNGASSRIEGEYMFFLLTRLPSHCPQGDTQLWESGCKKVAWETHHWAVLKSALSYCSTSLPLQVSYRVVCKPRVYTSVTGEGTPWAMPEKESWRKGTYLEIFMWRIQGSPL